ncbi:glycosyltransferase [Candidatus Lokiarchaeum ossiferum]|uniref:glycosyltransferase n=1 Tax=Candidatus Lokiarchaeum ossiferum TaxID=2951803 RepID=UPI00352C92D0
MKIAILGKDKEGWSIDNDRKYVRFFLSQLDVKLVKSLWVADIIYSVWYNELISIKYYFLLGIIKKIRKIKIIANITNEIHHYPQIITKLSNLVDMWISPNIKTHDLMVKKGFNSVLIPFYVDPNLFKKTNKSKKELCEILNIDYNSIKDKYLIGSFQRDSLGKNLLEPKWQKNPDLLLKILNNLPKNKILLLLAGPRRHYIIKKCIELDIPFIFIGEMKYIEEKKDDFSINTLNLKEIALLYNLIDVYIVSSKSEGGPKAILEVSLMKTLIFSTPVGLAPDMLSNNLIFNEENYIEVVSYIEQMILKKIDFQDEIEYNYKNVRSNLNKRNLIKKYDSIFHILSETI